nr:hypothetical protein [uncultured Flavonifractor sp.]
MDPKQTDPTALLARNRAKLEQAVRSPDAQRLMELLNQNAGSRLKGAAAAAARGDTGDLAAMVRQLMESKEGAQLIQRLSQTAPKEP